jgi:V8-like Glu-specific endopeptidase
LLLLSLSSTALAGDKKPLGIEAEPSQPIIGLAQNWEVIPDLDDVVSSTEGSFWVHLLYSRDASFLKAHLVNLNLKPGDVLTLRSRTGRVIEELTGRGPKNKGSFWTLSAFGEEMVLEFSHRHDYDVPPFKIDQVMVGNPGMFAPQLEPESICSPGDFEDVICYQSDPGKWANIFASAGVLFLGGDPNNFFSWICSASNVSPQNYLLTNDHCIATQAECDNAEFIFKFYNTGCNNGSPPTTDWVSFRCNSIVANSPFISCDQGLNDLDFSLCTVIGDPASTYGFVTPDPTPLTDGEAIYIVQHPQGRPHEITHGSGADVDVDGTVLRYYNTLDTEGGSSGSPLYRESDDKLIGLHHCGGCSTPGVGNRGMLMSDIYPHISPFLCSPAVDLVSAGIINLTEVSGNGDSVLDPGETWEYTPRVTNVACSTDALSVAADVQIGTGSENLTILTASVSFGTVPAGQTVSSSGPVQFQIDAAATCGGNVVLDLVNWSSSNGGPFPDSPDNFSSQIGGQLFTTVYMEDFSGGLGSWSIVNGGTGTGPAETWTTANPGARTLPLTGAFAIVDSDEHGTGLTMNEGLTSPMVDTSGYSQVTLQFTHDFNWFNGSRDEQCDVDVRSGATAGWVTVANYSGVSTSGTVEIDVTAQAAGQTDFEFRFHYHNAEFEWWWAIDDIFVLGSNGFSCSSPYFTEYGATCPGAGGFSPVLGGSGIASPGSTVTISLTGGQPLSVGFLFLSGLPDLSGSSCLQILPPFGAPVPMALDGTGFKSLTGPIPANLSPGIHAYAQWLGLDINGPPSTYSNGLDIFIQ